MILFPNAKINLGLDIIQKFSNGFHQISSCFLPVAWQDVLEILPSPKYQFVTSGITIPSNGKPNLCSEAYQLLKTDFDIPPVTIHLHKNIPIGAGLGGGSADASFTLKALHELFSLNIKKQKLEEYAAKLGSDCPFFIQNKTVLATETGTVFSEININTKAIFIVLIYPNLHISTAEAYANVTPRVPQRSVTEILKRPPKEWKKELKNDFEESLFPKYPILENLKKQFYNLGAFYSSMTGSGATVYGLFSEQPNLHFQLPKNAIVWKGKLL